jgi:hypothetical protein
VKIDGVSRHLTCIGLPLVSVFSVLVPVRHFGIHVCPAFVQFSYTDSEKKRITLAILKMESKDIIIFFVQKIDGISGE